MRGDALMAPAEVILDIRNYVTRLAWETRKGNPESTYSLPERKENDELDGDNFKEWAMFHKVASELDVELYETVHRN